MYASALAAKVPAEDVADFRSDTVTRPTTDMRAAMAAAAVGDDVYGDDPTVNDLEAYAADLMGKEAGLFLPSGTQSNLAAVMAHCGRGEQLLIGRDYHVFAHEAGGAMALGGIAVRTLPTRDDGSLAAAEITAAVSPDDPHCPPTRLLCLENTVSGRVIPKAGLDQPAAAARAAGLGVHMDGARFFNAVVALSADPAGLSAMADTVSLCLSKGLGAPVGSVLVGRADLLARARRNRKMLGGGMRQAGFLAAAGLFALHHHIDRLAEDHARARALAKRLTAIDGLEVDVGAVDSNMVFVTPRPDDHEGLCQALAEAGILVNATRPSLRLVLHLDIDDAKSARLAEVCEAFSLGR